MAIVLQILFNLAYRHNRGLSGRFGSLVLPLDPGHSRMLPRVFKKAGSPNACFNAYMLRCSALWEVSKPLAASQRACMSFPLVNNGGRRMPNPNLADQKR
ncbi:uncharacterized protein RSE6_05576 [Rhynchosporium secalis]|uniref:Uncharacterized protein n=1 Tax=Rhynchosporium secalis TaxID=38038 RepID=A0A1E1M857_RHYSE|nr:uncharacterized protein RSE6_05576 [Rhynchosporium secalis]